ncbi:MAG: hypothetical protein ACOH2Q_25325 [Rhodococcus sp. (in: high G+C Gram-positive bacteria)]
MTSTIHSTGYLLDRSGIPEDVLELLHALPGQHHVELDPAEAPAPSNSSTEP